MQTEVFHPLTFVKCMTLNALARPTLAQGGGSFEDSLIGGLLTFFERRLQEPPFKSKEDIKSQIGVGDYYLRTILIYQEKLRTHFSFRNPPIVPVWDLPGPD